MQQIPVSVQMFTLREECSQNFANTLGQVAALGFNGVEFAGYWGVQPEELRNILDGLGLRASGSHVALNLLENQLEEIIETQHIIGSKHIICPVMPLERRDKKEEYYRLAEQLNQFGETCKHTGLTFSYHNHDFELQDFGGITGLEIILEETNPEWVKAEFDVYWLTRAGHQPVEWLKRYQGRTPLVHLKDMTLDGEKFFAELGTGGVDLLPIIERGQENQVEWWVIEQDRSKRSPLESIATSIDFLKHNLLAQANQTTK